MALVSKALQKTAAFAAQHSTAIGTGVYIGMNTLGATSTYKDSREKGDSKVVSVAKAVGEFAFWELLGNTYAMPFMLAQTGASVLSEVIKTGGKIQEQGAKQVYGSAGKIGSGYFNMTEAGYTMRQRSINAIKNNGLNVNSVLGNEARTYYRSI